MNVKEIDVFTGGGRGNGRELSAALNLYKAVNKLPEDEFFNIVRHKGAICISGEGNLILANLKEKLEYAESLKESYKDYAKKCIELEDFEILGRYSMGLIEVEGEIKLLKNMLGEE